MVDGATDSKIKDSNVKHRTKVEQTVVDRKSDFDPKLSSPAGDHQQQLKYQQQQEDQNNPPFNTQIPGQFNYHPQQYKRIPEDCIDNNRSNVLACYKESPPQLLNDDEKSYSLKNGKGNGGNGNGNVSSNSDGEKFSGTDGMVTHIHKADFEQAIELTGYGKFHYLLLAICGLVSTSEEMDVISMSFILPSAQCDLDLNTQTKGWLNSIIFIGMMVGAYVWGSIADTVGRRKVLIVISFMNAVCIVASSFSQTYTLFMIFRFLNGVA